LKVWESYDATKWDLLGELNLTTQSWLSQLVGSSLGYVLVASDAGRFGGQVARLWFSPDGILWQESADPFGRSESEIAGASNGNAWLQVAATDRGFLAWLTSGYPAVAVTTRLAFSPDGRRWTEVAIDEPQRAAQLMLAQLGSTILGLSLPASGAPATWLLDLEQRGPMHLEHIAAWDESLRDASIANLAGDGSVVYAFGAVSGDGAAQVWANDGSGWRPRPMPGDFALGTTVTASGRPGAVVLTGARPSAAGDNPVFWHLRGDGRWLPEADPLLAAVPDPTPEQCGDLPARAIDFFGIDATWGPTCFGDAPMTFTAWSAACDWCNDESDPAIPWLLNGNRTLMLAPIGPTDYISRDVMLARDIGWDRSLTSTWLRVSGHYDDASAADCGSPEQADAWGFYNGGYWGLQRAIEYCRQRFVVTSVEVIAGDEAAPTPSP
jgi:hypothetical protein